MHAEVAELADATDSKSVGAHTPCGFDSHLRHSGQADEARPICFKRGDYITGSGNSLGKDALAGSGAVPQDPVGPDLGERP